MDLMHDVITFISQSFILRESRVAIFADIFKSDTMLIKEIFKDSI